jgi:hypothetical protein
MQKSSFCETHFLMSCPLCNEGPTSTPVPIIPTPLDITIPLPEKIEISPSAQKSYDDSGPQQPPVSSPEAVKVTNVTEEYARACDKYEEACTAVKKTEEHIQNMREILEELIKARESAHLAKIELKKKVLETLAGEE